MDSKTEFRIQKFLNYFAENYPRTISQGVYNYAWEILELLDEETLGQCYLSLSVETETLNMSFGNMDRAFVGIYLSSYGFDEDEVIKASVTYVKPHDHHFLETSLLTEEERKEFAGKCAVEIMAPWHSLSRLANEVSGN